MVDCFFSSFSLSTASHQRTSWLPLRLALICLTLCTCVGVHLTDALILTITATATRSWRPSAAVRLCLTLHLLLTIRPHRHPSFPRRARSICGTLPSRRAFLLNHDFTLTHLPLPSSAGLYSAAPRVLVLCLHTAHTCIPAPPHECA